MDTTPPPQQLRPPRLTWKPLGGGWTGRAGDLHLFTISWDTRTEDGPWRLTTRLPVRSPRLGRHMVVVEVEPGVFQRHLVESFTLPLGPGTVAHHHSVAAAQDAAERVLAAFLRRVDTPADQKADRD